MTKPLVSLFNRAADAFGEVSRLIRENIAQMTESAGFQNFLDSAAMFLPVLGMQAPSLAPVPARSGRPSHRRAP